MSNTILIKKSTTPGAIPGVANIALGELALNSYDGRLFTKIDTGTPSVFELTQNQPITVTGNVTGTSVNGTGNSSIALTLSTTGVTAGTYGGTSGASSNVGVFTVDQYGRVTSASNVTISTSSLANGTANIQIFNNGNISLSPAGTANVAVFANNGEYVTGILSVTGNIIGGNVNTAGQVSAGGNITGGNIVTAAAGNLVLGNASSYLAQSGSNAKVNLASSVTLTPDTTADPTSGVIIGGSGYLLATNGARNAVLNYGSGSGVFGIYTINVYGNTATAITNGGANGVGNIGAGSTGRFNTLYSIGVDASGVVNAGSVTVGTTISATGNITGGNVTTAGNVAAGGVLTDNYYYANGAPVDFQQAAGSNTQLQFNSNNDFGASANLTFNSTTNILTVTGVSSTTGNVIGGNINTAGLVSAGGNVIAGNINTTGNVSATGNIAGGNITIVGNVETGGIKTDNYYYANGAPVDFQQPAGSNTQIQFNNDNDFGASANFTFDTVANVLLVNATANVGNTNVTGYVSATANVTGGNLSTGGLITATGNITGGNVITSGLATVTGNITGGNVATSGLVTASGNITGGNVLTGGLISASGSLTAASVATGGTVSAAANVTGGNIVTAGVVQAPTVTNAGGSITVSTGSNGNINLSPNGTGNVIVNARYINSVADPVQNQDVATKNYVDNMVSAGIAYHQPVLAATTTTLAIATGGTVTYNNGTAGVGATLTTTGAFNLIDTANVQTANTRILVKNEANAAWNGVYGWANATTIVRTADADEYGPDSATQLSLNDYFFVQSGNVNAGSAFVVSAPTGTITFGTSDITFAQFSSSQTYTANTAAGVVLNGTVINAKVDNISTGFDGTGNIVVKASAQLTTPNIGAATGTSLSTTGNVTGGNIDTAGLASVTGNVIGGNISTAGLVTATGNVTGGNINTGGLASITGNVIGGNLTTAGTANVATLIVTTLANITATTVSTNTTTGALKVAGGVGVVGNVYAGSLYSAGEAVLTVNSTIDGGTY